MKNVLIVDVGEAYGGIEKYIYNIYTHIDHDLIHIDFLIYSNHCAYEDSYIAKSNIYCVTSRRTNPMKHKKEIIDFFRTHKYDSVWVQTCSASNITAQKIARRYSDAIIITHAHVAKAEPKGFIHDCIATGLHIVNRPRLNKITDVRLACSKEAAAYLFGNKFVSMTKIVNNGIDVTSYKITDEVKTSYRNDLNINENDLVIGHVGRFSKVKNHEFIIIIFYELQKKISEAKLLLVGDGEERSNIEKIVKELRIETKVIFTGARNDIPQLLSIMDVFLFPSINEGFGIAAIEAQVTGVPVLMNENLSKELVISNGCKALSIKAPVSVWVDEINRARNVKLVLTDSVNKYDINTTAKEIERIIGERTK